MTTTADGFFRGLFEGCISRGDASIQRRPYHRNCGCAIHDSRGRCLRSSLHNSVSYPIRRSWREGFLEAVGGNSSPPPLSSYGSPAAAREGLKQTASQLVVPQEEGHA